MVSQKNQYRYVDESALKYISIKGVPYPVRPQKLVALGEDWAFLKEAVLERQNMMASGGTSEYDKYALPIRFVDRMTERTFYDAVKPMCNGVFAYWAKLDEMKFANTSVADFIVDIDESYSERYRKDSERFSELVRTRDENCKSLRRDFSKAKEENDEKLSDDLKAEDESFASKSNKAVDDCYDKKSELEKKHAVRLTEIRESNDRKLQMLNEKLRNETDLSKRNEIEAEIEKAVVEGKENVEAENDGYDRKVHDVEQERDVAIEEARSLRGENVKKLNDDYSQWLKEAQKNLDDGIAREREVCQSACYALTQSSGIVRDTVKFKAVTDYEDAVVEAKIKASCADRFFSRTLMFGMASTPLNRVFADLERMTVLSGLSFLRRPYECAEASRKELQYLNYFDDWVNVPSSSMVYSKDSSGETKFSSTKFGLYYGSRLTADRVSRMFADLLMVREESAVTSIWKETKPAVGNWSDTSGYEKGDEVMFTGRVYYTDSYFSDWYYAENKRFAAKDEISPVSAPRTRFTLVDWEQVEDTVTKSKSASSRQWFVIRVELSRTSSGSEMVREIDERYDRYVADVKKENESYADAVEKKESERDAELRKKAEARDKAIESAQKTLDANLERNNLAFVAEALSGSAEINKSIVDAVFEPSKMDEILRRWRTGTYDKAVDSKSEKDRTARDRCQKSVSAANKNYDDAESDIKERYAEVLKEMKKDHVERLEKLRAVWGKDEKGKSVMVSGYLKDKADLVKKHQTDPVKKAKDAYDADVESAAARLEKDKGAAYGDFEKAAREALQGTQWAESPLPLDDAEKVRLAVLAPEKYALYATAETAYAKSVADANDVFYDARNEAAKTRWESLCAISAASQDARDLWEAEVKPVGQDRVVPGQGEHGESLSESHVCEIEKVLNVFAVYEPGTLTGADFSKYYKELEEEQSQR